MECSYEFDWVNIILSDIRNFISHITPLCSLLYMLLKDKYICTCVCRGSENCKSLVLLDKCILKYFCPLKGDVFVPLKGNT